MINFFIAFGYVIPTVFSKVQIIHRFFPPHKKGRKEVSNSLLYKPPLTSVQRSDSYSNTTLVEIADTIVTVAACLLLVVSTIVLYFIHSTIRRLGVVAGFIIVFSIMLKVFTKGSRIDILAAAAAYVFLQPRLFVKNTFHGNFISSVLILRPGLRLCRWFSSGRRVLSCWLKGVWTSWLMVGEYDLPRLVGNECRLTHLWQVYLGRGSASIGSMFVNTLHSQHIFFFLYYYIRLLIV